jgi:DNA-binding transcriptional MerR regulator
LTIGQAAKFVGVTVKTVRHYHRLGLVEEPRRDHSGYRRYALPQLLRLVQARTLAEAGVPLAEVAAMLDAPQPRFIRALAEVERGLDAQVAKLVERRARLRRLASGNRALLPERACALLDRAVALGFPPASIESIRESLVLARAMIPRFDDFLTEVERSLRDRKYVALLKRWWVAKNWPADDPRVDRLAREAAGHLLANRRLTKIQTGFLPKARAASQHALLDEHRAATAPSWVRLSALIEARLRAEGVAIPGR